MAQEQSTLPLFQFQNLRLSEIHHVVTKRGGGVSKGNYESLNLGDHVDDNPDAVKENRRRLTQQFLGHQICFPNQTHSTNVQVVVDGSHQMPIEDCDALITNIPNLPIGILTADCVPILLFDPEKRVVGAVHAGWRGTVGKILSKTVLEMKNTFGVSPKTIMAGIGPSISPEVYEVGEEVVEQVVQTLGEGLIRSEGERHYFNLWEANRRQLNDLGVRNDNIEIAEICTYQRYKEFFSARRLGLKSGRFASVIMLNS